MLAVAVCAVAVLALLAAERWGWQPGIWIFKPLAAAAFLELALSLGALDTTYGRQVLAGLALCAVGDVLLIPRGQSVWFLLGIGAFLLGHVAYAIAFSGLALDGWAAASAAAVIALLAWRVHAWLTPRIPADLALPVRLYMGVISVMVVVAVAASAAGAAWTVAGGAIAFALSDVSVARERFVHPGFVNSAWGLPLYFAAQLVIASTIA